jgi:hypothetical protein
MTNLLRFCALVLLAFAASVVAARSLLANDCSADCHMASCWKVDGKCWKVPTGEAQDGSTCCSWGGWALATGGTAQVYDNNLVTVHEKKAV